MKNVNRYSLLFWVLGTVLMVLGSCKKYLELSPKDQVSDGNLWESTNNADLFLNTIYGSIENPSSVPIAEDPRENFSDNSMNSVAGRYTRTVYALSVYTPSYTNPGFGKAHEWNQYDNIRKCNVFIKNVADRDFPEEWKKVRLAEARFLRAFYYQLLWTVHGGVPIITDVLNLTEQGEDNFRPRATAGEVADFLVSELEAAANDLPVVAEQQGRITKGAALTLKGWVELFYASPLHNASNDLKRWSDAAATYKRVMELNQYELFPDYNTLFFEENNYNSEVIFATPSDINLPRMQNRRSYMHAASYVGNTFRGFALTTPTQELVDEYCMANGLPISDPASGYDPQKPYEGREKRFYESIIYDGSTWLETEMVMKQGVGSPSATDLSDASEATNTGYYWRKGLNPKYAIVGDGNNKAAWVWFRYAEVLLGYAEAQNEAVGPDASVYAAVNRVRDRAELPALPLGLTQEQMRIAIQRERRVELAFEEKRWYDLLRLKLAETKLNGFLHAMLIEQVSGVWVYKVIQAPGGERKFYPEKNYFLPIPQSALDRNKQLVQNPNY
mgnify:CR=1 FL=1